MKTAIVQNDGAFWSIWTLRGYFIASLPSLMECLDLCANLGYRVEIKS
jgi:hypothetical protein